MYRTARAHPPSCCQVSFRLTLQLAPDLTGTLPPLPPPPTLSASLSAHLRVCAHACTHGTATQTEAFFSSSSSSHRMAMMASRAPPSGRTTASIPTPRPHPTCDVSHDNQRMTGQPGASFATPHTPQYSASRVEQNWGFWYRSSTK